MRAFLILTFLWSTLGWSQQSVSKLLIARNTGIKILANQDTIRVFGFAESLNQQPGVPGPTIIANEGDSVHIDLWNVSQGAPHTIHLHGLDVNQENDGVPHLSFDVGHMDHGYYNFKAPHAGTYLYHCHVASTIHVQAGMYGLIIIKPTDGSNTTWNGGFPFEKEYSYFLSEIDTTWHNNKVLEHDHDTGHSVQPVHIPKFEPQFFLINGFSDQQLVNENQEFNSTKGEVDYIRLTNIGYYGSRVIFPAELNAKIISSDGRPFANPEASDTVFFFPGERYGVLTEASSEFTGQIRFDYIDLNTMAIKNTQIIPVNVSGVFSSEFFESKVSALNVFPNPFDDNALLQFNLLDKGEVEIKIFDLAGKQVFRTTKQYSQKGKYAVPVGKLIESKGTYILKIALDGQYIGSVKIVKH